MGFVLEMVCRNTGFGIGCSEFDVDVSICSDKDLYKGRNGWVVESCSATGRGMKTFIVQL